MARPQNRSQLMKHLGAVQANTMWSWCAVNESERKVYFSVWTDHIEKVDGKPVYTIQGPSWGLDENGRRMPARKDHDGKLALVFDQGYEAWAYFIEAKDRQAIPREIAAIRTTFVMQMELSRNEEGWVTGVPARRVEIR
jgi:hypothetical protein